jgi:hypothetical protein
VGIFPSPASSATLLAARFEASLRICARDRRAKDLLLGSRQSESKARGSGPTRWLAIGLDGTRGQRRSQLPSVDRPKLVSISVCRERLKRYDGDLLCLPNAADSAPRKTVGIHELIPVLLSCFRPSRHLLVSRIFSSYTTSATARIVFFTNR